MATSEAVKHLPLNPSCLSGESREACCEILAAGSRPAANPARNQDRKPVCKFP